jgi:hypothetical protein
MQLLAQVDSKASSTHEQIFFSCLPPHAPQLVTILVDLDMC